MSEHPAERALDKWEKYFFMSLFFAIATLVLQRATGWEFLDWARAGAWSAAGVCSLQTMRALRRLGRDGAWTVFRALMCFAFAALALL